VAPAAVCSDSRHVPAPVSTRPPRTIDGSAIVASLLAIVLLSVRGPARPSNRGLAQPIIIPLVSAGRTFLAFDVRATRLDVMTSCQRIHRNESRIIRPKLTSSPTHCSRARRPVLSKSKDSAVESILLELALPSCLSGTMACTRRSCCRRKRSSSRCAGSGAAVS
jgi:hypothetical protein